MRHTFRKHHRRSRTRRSRRGGAESELEKIIASVPMNPNVLVNPTSKFVVITYWWGRGNLNRNTQRPCPEDIVEEVKEGIEDELEEEDEEFKTIRQNFIAAKKELRAAGDKATKEQGIKYRDTGKLRTDYLNNYFKRPTVMQAIKAGIPAQENIRREKKKKLIEENKKRLAEGKEILGNPEDIFTEPIKFEQMIANWENSCKAAGCNYMAVEYPQFARPGGYQLAINAKPLFIREALKVLGGRSALYIDGDMIINKYPTIFDMPNVDFMARGWNIDPRSAATKYKKVVCFDPYVFETSGGTMFFANTPMSTALLTDWHKESSREVNKGKADDRILSLIFTSKSYVTRTNVVQLPIEYLWLGEIYDGVIDPADMDRADVLIEHPECLTGEERAQDLSAASASNSRQPKFYASLIESEIECNERGGVFYERIFFQDKKFRDGFAPYLKYMKNARNLETGKPLFEVIDFEDGYGRYNTTVFKNREPKLEKVLIESPTQASLPLGAPIPTILANLLKGVDVKLGDVGQVPPLTECVASLAQDGGGIYMRGISLDITKPMFFSAKNPIIVQLIAMCETLEDINKHLRESYVFVSRIRWTLKE